MEEVKKYIGKIKDVDLFLGVKEKELESLLDCMSARVVHAKKDEILLLAGERPECVGILLAGQLYIVKEDYDGNRTLVAAIMPGEIFAEALCCAGVLESPVSVMSDTDATVLLLRFEPILHPCNYVCDFHVKLIENMMRMIARKNIMLQSRMDVIVIKSIRAKVLRYLNTFMLEQGENITIPFNREELANYLCVERSALSHELSRMKKDGLIDYWKNNFILLE